MTRAMYIAAVFAFATVLTQANQCANGGTGCTGDNVPQNIVSMLQTNLKTNVLKDGGEEAAALEGDQGTGIFAGKERSQLGSLSAKGNSNAILTELEEHVRSGTTPPFEVISQIKSLIMDDIMPDLQTARYTVAQDTTKVMSEIATCNNDFISSEAYPGSTLQESVNSTRQDHKTCRHAQKAMFNANLTGDDSDCVKLGNLLHRTFPSTSPDPGNRAAAVQYVNNTLPVWETILELNAKCATQEKQLVDKDAECSTDQKTFESDFCYWKSELESDCKVLDSCYSRSLSLYTDHVAKMKVLYQKWDIESATLQKILCFCNVWLEARDEDDNRSDHNATHFAVCSKITHTPTPLEIESPEKVDCLLSSVAKHPGTQAFVTKEYINFTSFVAEVASCPQAPTLVPTTVAPTSSTQAPTTASPTTAAPTTEATTCTADYIQNPGEGQRSYSSGAGGMLHSSMTWWPGRAAVGEYMIMDLGVTAKVAGVVTQARHDQDDQWVKTFTVQHSTDGNSWQDVPGTFNSVTDGSRDTVARALFPVALSLRYVKLIVQTWHNYPSMRAAVLMCDEFATTTTPPTTIPSARYYPKGSGPPPGFPAFPKIVGQGSWYGMPREQVTNERCSNAWTFPAYSMLYNCNPGGPLTSWVGPDCNGADCSDFLWWTMDLGEVKHVNTITILPGAPPVEYYTSSHYELLISTNTSGPEGPYDKRVSPYDKGYPSFAVTSKGFTQVVENNFGRAIIQEYNHQVNAKARFIMFHAIGYIQNGFSAGVQYLKVDAV